MQRSLTVGSSIVVAEVADTPALRERGLSGHAPLKAGEGMLFVFDQSGPWGFWMKDMSFAIDLLWLDESGRVVTLLANVSPDSYPQTFYPKMPARYVLELPAGFAATQGIAEGSQIVL